MISSPFGLLTLAFGLLSALAVLVGGIVLFVVGKGRGALPGAGFVVLGLGTGISGLISVLLPRIELAYHLSLAAVNGAYSGIWLIFALIGWGLVVAALYRFRAEPMAAPSGYPPQPPGPYPPPDFVRGYPQPGPYDRPGAPPPAAPGQGHSVPGPGPERPPYDPGPRPGDDRPNPGWGGPPYGTEGPPPPPGV